MCFRTGIAQTGIRERIPKKNSSGSYLFYAKQIYPAKCACWGSLLGAIWVYFNIVHPGVF